MKEMNAMKNCKLLICIIAIAAVLCFVGCNSNDINNDSEINNNTPTLPDLNSNNQTELETEPLNQDGQTVPAIVTNPESSTTDNETESDTNVTDPNESESAENPTDSEATTPNDTEPVQNNKPDLSMTYEEFQNLTPAKMREFEESFESKEAFFDWYNAAKEAYENANPPIDAGDGVITLPTD